MWIPYLFPQIRASMRRRKSTPIAKSRKTTPPSPNTRYQPHRHHKGFVYSLFSISHSLLFLLSFLFSLSPLFPLFSLFFLFFLCFFIFFTSVFASVSIRLPSTLSILFSALFIIHSQRVRFGFTTTKTQFWSGEG